MIKTEGAGKGDNWRENFNYNNYWNNFDEIKKSKDKPEIKEQKLKGGKVRYTFR